MPLTQNQADPASRAEVGLRSSFGHLPANGERAGSTEIPWRLDSDRRSDRVRLLNPPTLDTTMQVVADRAAAPTAIQTDLRAIFVSLELSRSTWLITSLSPGGGEKMSKHSIQAGDIAGLLKRFA